MQQTVSVSHRANKRLLSCVAMQNVIWFSNANIKAGMLFPMVDDERMWVLSFPWLGVSARVSFSALRNLVGERKGLCINTFLRCSLEQVEAKTHSPGERPL